MSEAAFEAKQATEECKLADKKLKELKEKPKQQVNRKAKNNSSKPLKSWKLVTSQFAKLFQ